jgi:hypothetical protein
MVATEEQIRGRHHAGWIWNWESEGNVWEESQELWIGTCQASDVKERCYSARSNGCGRVVGTGVVLGAATDGDVG